MKLYKFYMFLKVLLVFRTSSVLRPLMGTRTTQIATSPARLGGRQG